MRLRRGDSTIRARIAARRHGYRRDRHGDTAKHGVPEDAVAAEAWVDEVCTSVSAWQTDVETSRGDLQAALTNISSVGDARGALTTFLADVVERTDELRADVEAAGTPAVEAGGEVRDTLQSSLTQVRETFEQARADAEELPTDDPGAFLTGAQELATSIGLGVSGAVQALQDLSAEPGLAAAIGRAPRARSSPAEPRLAGTRRVRPGLRRNRGIDLGSSPAKRPVGARADSPPRADGDDANPRRVRAPVRARPNQPDPQFPELSSVWEATTARNGVPESGHTIRAWTCCSVPRI